MIPADPAGSVVARSEAEIGFRHSVDCCPCKPSRLSGSCCPTCSWSPCLRPGSPRTPIIANPRMAALSERLEIGDDVIDVLGVLKAAKGHAISWHLRLRVGNISAQVGIVPDDVRALHRVRIPVILEHRRFTADDALEARANRIRPISVACYTGLEEQLAVFAVGGKGCCRNNEGGAGNQRR
jgi:hypothetical protein